jgi:hypothetical protein
MPALGLAQMPGVNAAASGTRRPGHLHAAAWQTAVRLALTVRGCRHVCLPLRVGGRRGRVTLPGSPGLRATGRA